MTNRSGVSPGRPDRHSRLFFLLSLMALIASLLMPVLTLTASDAAAAQGQPPNCDPGYVVSDDGSECIPDPNQQQDQQQDQQQQQQQQCPEGQIPDGNGGCVQDPNLQPQTADSYIQIDKFDCPSGQDYSSGDYGLLQGNCPQNQQPVTISVNGQGQQIGGSGQWGPFNPGAGGYQIAEQVPPGYGQPWVFCGAYIPNQSQPSFSPMGQTSSFNWNLNDNESLYCQIYNISTAPQYGTTIVHKFACPDGYTGDPYQATFDQLQGFCQQPMANVAINYLQNGGPVGQVVTNQQGVGQWDQAPAGQYMMQEQLPPDYAYAVVHCSYHEANQGNFNGQSSPMPMQDATSFAGTMDPGYVLDCYWFNFPTDQIQLYKYWCPPDYTAPQGATEQDYQGACQAPPAAQINWMVADTNGRTLGNPQPNGNGYGSYAGLTQDQPISVLEQMPGDAGYGPPVVYCYEYQRGFPGQPTSSYPYDPTTGVQWTPHNGYYLVCKFYNYAQETGGGNAITLYKWVCQPGTEYGQSLDYYQGLGQDQGPCEQEHMDVPFTVMDASGPQQKNTVHNTTWENLAVPGDSPITMQESIPDGYGEPMVFCWYNDGDAQPMQTANGLLSLPAGPSEPWNFYCNWYNIPTEQGNSLDLYKYYCQGPAPENSDKSWYEQNCQPVPQWDFQLEWTGGGNTQTTDDTGYTGWSGLPTGTWTLTEFLPDSYLPPVVYCRYVEWPDEAGVNGEWAQFEAPGGVYQNGFGYEGMRMECHWYNISAEQGNSLDLYKYYCQGPAPENSDKSWYEQNCQPVPQWDFQLEWTGGGNTQTTDDTGYTGWSGLPTGTWTLTEFLPDSYLPPVVYCRYVEWPDDAGVNGEWAQFEAPGGVYQNGFGYEGMRMECHWYNIGGGDTAGMIVVEKYWCPPGLSFVQTPTRSDMMAACQEAPGTGANFSLTGPTAAPQSWPEMQPSGPSPQSFTWQDLPAGEYNITESGLGDGWTSTVYCHASNGEENGVADEMLSGPTVTRMLESGYAIDCAWFNQPGNDQTTVTVTKYNCDAMPEGAQTLNDWQTACPTQGDGWTFSLTDSTSTTTDKTTSGGTAEWTDVPEGTFTLTETMQPGWGEPVVWCGWTATYKGAVFDAFPQQVQTTGGSYMGEIAYPGTTYFCYWFNIPEQPTDNTVTIYKWLCNEGTEYGQPLSYYQGEGQDQGPCEQEHLNLPIHLIHGGAQQDTTTQANGTQFNNVSLDTNGSFQVWIEEPDGYGTPMVFCGTLDQDTMSPVGAVNDRITISPSGEPFAYQCNWYNIPGDGNTITIYKWLCAPGTEYGRELEYYQGGLPDQDIGPCEQEHLNIPISLIDGSPTSPYNTTTQANGTQFDNVVLDQGGSFQVAITEPLGYGDPMVFCAPIDGDTQNPYPAAGGMWTIAPGGEPFSWQCNVYDIPQPGYQLELYKYTCDYTVDRNLGLPDLGSNPNCKPLQGASFTPTFNGTTGSASYTDLNGYLNWADVEGGPWSLSEGAMTGYDTPKVYCGPPQSGETPEVPVTNLTVSGTLDQTTPHIVCYWFNFELPTMNGRITIYKFQCPPGTTSSELGMLQESCLTPHNGIGFNLSGNGVNTSASTVSGTVDWSNLEQGQYTVTETTALPGYGPSVVYCATVVEDGAELDPGSISWQSQTVTNQAIQLTLDNLPKRIVCYWYNFPADPGEITIYKWTCPAGYDLGAWNANPKVDCVQATNGVTFTLQPPVGVNLQSDTGDSINGAVYFGGLDPGAYSITETVPMNTSYVFVLDCTGTNIPKVHQYPLSWGNKLDINVAGGDKIVCNWYNVPAPQKGWVTVTKFVCTTSTFVDKVYCQVYEKGQSVELIQVNGNVSKGVGITNAGGTYTWQNLNAGSYTVREQGMVPCKMTASMVDGKGNATVVAGKGTMVYIYNCSSTPGKVPPGKVPTKYPNTGVPPESATAMHVSALQSDPTGTPTAEDEAASEAFYQVDCLNGDVETGTPPASTPDTEATAPPIEAEPTEAPDGAGPPATPPPAPEGSQDGCERGAVPVHLTVESVGIDANFEYKEIVDGLMEQPTGPDDVAWFKDTARLGESNNVVVAGHLNWWNVPEGVFYRLQDMQEGDRVDVTGDDGMVYTYEVRTVTQESNLEPPGIDVIGPTDEPTLTLITCGGEWNTEISEYDERTVVRAVLVDTQPADTSQG